MLAEIKINVFGKEINFEAAKGGLYIKTGNRSLSWGRAEGFVMD